MSELTNNCGPVFPRPFSQDIATTPKEWAQDGMALRDWFAGHALTGMMGFATGGTFDPSKNCDRFAEAAYALSDAMIAARKGGPES